LLETQAPKKGAKIRRMATKCFVVVLVAIIAVDTAPLAIQRGSGPLPLLYDMKASIRPFLRPTGLWQAEWRLFAPDPIISNNWWTIEVSGAMADELVLESGQLSSRSWNTPFWGEVGPLEKFYKRRHIAYFRRLSDFPRAVAEDYLDFWVRERFGDRLRPLADAAAGGAEINAEIGGNAGETARLDAIAVQPVLLELNLYRNELKLAFPDDGSLPTRDETVWLSVTEKYLQRKYGP
jgi:hypothetical protein